MGNEQSSQIVQARGIETNQDESARPPIVRYSIGDEENGYLSEHRTPCGAVRNVVTEAPRSASFQIFPPMQAEVFRTPEECHITSSNSMTYHQQKGMVWVAEWCSGNVVQRS